MILLLDNHDSFVHNLARFFRIAGCETKVVRSDAIDLATCTSLRPTAIVLSPGPKGPQDAGCSVEVIQGIDERMPILGVCLGHQSIAVAFGGKVHQCGPMHGMATQIRHDEQGVFKDCPSPMSVGRYHSLAIDQCYLPDELEVSATTEDGIIMGVRHRTRPVFGVQFHPESVLSDHGMKVIENFVTLTSHVTESAAS
ncbi:anthranilate synthase component II [Planctomycetes bacterium K23_9]|uniref:Aminodeoxychorismate synthase component 2 n=1 Tax=Stieleria marina TaxID=1930275 RepID=A0A517P0R2_9BACT|nr:Aminodeoxychorismate synthase component 2 [Planctomycetes bacterium K23_9]